VHAPGATDRHGCPDTARRDDGPRPTAWIAVRGL
jgi:hypothetical protein